ncbi:MAG TPA: WD40 repeat domain-containing protein [Modicisalibacter sp.]|nr:WD40 repeat domain-containing protein [Modicisalibacter sp.]
MFLTACASNSSQPGGKLGPAMVIGVSSDGRYAISTHKSKHLVLWNLQRHSRKILSTNANIYSAYFIHDRAAFLWQDLNDTVRVQTVDGEVLKQFEHFPTYGHVMDTSLTHYIASDENWNLFYAHGEEMQSIKRDGTSPSFLGSGKLMHLTLSEDAGLFVSSGSAGDEEFDPAQQPPILDDQLFSYYGGVVLWDLDTLKPIANLPGNNNKVDATISLDGQWVITGDEAGIGRFWDTGNTSENNLMASYYNGIFLEDSDYDLDDPRKFDDSGLIPVPLAEEPNRWGSHDYLVTNTTVALAFINDSEEFLRFGTYSHWVALFEAGNPWPQKYFDLGTDPWPSTSSYLRSLSMATSPQANVLVTGHRDGGGISVYRYDPEARTLTKTWVSE